jgi:uncharacterized membrane protein YidH (DUF202 family)
MTKYKTAVIVAISVGAVLVATFVCLLVLIGKAAWNTGTPR